MLSDALRLRVYGWLEKYEASGYVTCLCHESSDAEAVELEREKAANVAGMIAGMRKEAGAGQSSAGIGKQLGERALRRLII